MCEVLGKYVYPTKVRHCLAFTKEEQPKSTFYSSNESKGSPLAHGRSDQIRLSDLIGCPIQRYGAADVSCGDGAVIRRLSGDQRIDPR
ncbi:hypothetical protein NDU88_003252 [Pleurodeles waltl]|uniref:Uncharacterized protein n=1 Tax=Pleurodeles waltl TaxID=8319 RepID=A0AAV7SF38_PLEWA|nr:hypothetical protein NDU88_003252 [Pleurodeles waltl]